MFDTLDHVTTMAWVALMPLTGRTHQLRAHMAAIDTPIVGDGKYGKEPSRSHGEIPNRLMLHARSLRIRHPKGTIWTSKRRCRRTWRRSGTCSASTKTTSAIRSRT